MYKHAKDEGIFYTNRDNDLGCQKGLMPERLAFVSMCLCVPSCVRVNNMCVPVCAKARARVPVHAHVCTCLCACMLTVRLSLTFWRLETDSCFERSIITARGSSCQPPVINAVNLAVLPPSSARMCHCILQQIPRPAVRVYELF